MWRRYVYYFLGALLLGLGLPSLLILLIDPYGNSPIGVASRHPIIETNQRFVYPQIVRSGDYDAFVIGTSTSRLLEPERLNQAFGGRFANLAMNSATAWEQAQMMGLILRTTSPRMLIIGLDTVWCSEDADTQLVTETRSFPHWLYDEDMLNDLQFLLNFKTIELSYKRLVFWLGAGIDHFQRDGFDDFTKKKQYSAERARQKIYGNSARPREPIVPAFKAADPSTEWRLPALDWLDDILSNIGDRGRALLIFMPVHTMAQPTPGSEKAAQEQECKRRISELASKRGAFFADYRVHSEITNNDDNFWDPLHWRIEIGRQLINDIRRSYTNWLPAKTVQSVP